MRPSRLPAALFASALVVMTGAVGWLVWESQRTPAPASPAATKTAAAPKVTKSPSRAVLPPEPDGEPIGHAEASPQLETLNVPGSVPNEALLTFRTAEALAAFRDRAAALGLEVLGYDPKLRTARVRFHDLSGLERDLHDYGKDYSHVGPNYIVRVPGLPVPAQTDTANAGGREPFRSQGLEMIGATADRSAWGQGVTVAVIDSGIASHPSLQNAQITHIDMLNDGSTMNGHGTAMASLIAGNDETVGGVAPASKLIDIRVTDADGISNTALLSSAIVKATDLGARVINISLGSGTSTPMLEEAVRYAQSHNVLIVAAAGNEQQTSLAMPAGLPGVISVGAVDATGTQAWFSNSGNGLTLAAPGVGIVSGYTGNKFVISSGTSQATAITTGVVASLLSRGYYAQNIIPLLTRTAKPLQASPQAVGAGLIQITK
ncbi:MAG: S8 family serine peptidase [Prosthecobacter sp.]|jgi:thermitase|uniref:S8 family peptidase n=1 Tax=Prosthecobacter sp. TaxID=1965333 RepID=UPI0019E792E4|nr:S8 family serine peptidase [Prosthecobacter sp.]MBE2283033.1 S8 family serine peptidase [Prosthecobacter sp.]